jgi:AbrB family looped-hinge helix DNA binding protein
MEVATVAKVTAKYQITIPIRVRKELCIVPGSEVDISKEGERYILVVDPVEAIRKKWRGRFRDKSTTMEYLEEVRGSVQ